MHTEQREYIETVKSIFPDHFVYANVLDIGSLDVNGTNKYLFVKCNYTGVDIEEGKNVDIACPVHLAELPSGYYDTVVSTECFEHDQWFHKTIETIVRVLKKNGLFAMTCAGPARPEHGTQRTDTGSSPFTTDYYQNRTKEDFNIEGMKGYCTEARNGQDIYYCGVKL
jgi:SAM-dependent methyltransferase